MKDKDDIKATMRAVVLGVTATLCMLFLLYLNSEPKPVIIRTEKSTSDEKPKATSVLLVRATNTSIYNARSMLAEFDQQFNLQFKYPITVFHEEDFDATYKARLQDAVKSVQVDFALVKFEFPEWIDQSAVPATFEGWMARHTSIGYRHMCRFFSGEIFKHPALAPYDYYWRLDDDSQYLNKIENDPFVYMQKNRKVYGWNIWMYESQPIAGKSLWIATNEYARAHKITPSSEYKTIETIGGDYDRCHYWNNFELLDLNFFRSPLYMDFYDYLDHKGGFYFSRWGDALVRTVFLKLFMQHDDIHYFDDIAYKHQGMCSLVTPIKGLKCYDVHPDDGKHGDCKLIRRHIRGLERYYSRFIFAFVSTIIVNVLYRYRKSIVK